MGKKKTGRPRGRMPKRGVEKSVQTIFTDRLKREGRIRAFEDRIAERREELSRSRIGVLWEVMREFGYLGPDHEREIYQNYLDSTARQQQAVEEAKKELVEERAVSDDEFDKALAALSDANIGDLPDDLFWLYTHPAMMRSSRSADRERVILTADDLKHKVKRDDGSWIKATTGSVQMLQHFCNEPREFYKLILGRLKKLESTKKEEDVQEFDRPEDLGMIKKMIERAGNASS